MLNEDKGRMVIRFVFFDEIESFSGRAECGYNSNWLKIAIAINWKSASA